MKKLAVWTLTYAAVMVGGVGIAMSDDAAPALPEPPTFADIDANGDQYIDAEELTTFIQNARPPGRKGGGKRGNRDIDPMEKADVNGDGLLDETEFNEFRDRMRERRDRMFERRFGSRPGQA